VRDKEDESGAIMEDDDIILVSEETESIQPNKSSILGKSTPPIVNNLRDPIVGINRNKNNNTSKEYSDESNDYQNSYSEEDLEIIIDSDDDPVAATSRPKRFKSISHSNCNACSNHLSQSYSDIVVTSEINLATLNLSCLQNRSEWLRMKQGYIYKNEMSPAQQHEINLLNIYICNYILDKYKLKTICNKILKSETGFSIIRSCHFYRSRGCRSKWTLSIYIGQDEARLCCENKCQHLLNPNQPVSQFRTHSSDIKFIKTLEISLPLSIEIWESINMNIHSSYKSKAILTQQQSEELNKIEMFCLDTVKTLGFETKLNRWRKSDVGYTLYNTCHVAKEKKCNSTWIFKINILASLMKIFFNKRCKHVIN